MKINWALLSHDTLPSIDGSFSLIRLLHTIYTEENTDKAPFVFFTMEVAINKDEAIEKIELVIHEDDNEILVVPGPAIGSEILQDGINFLALCIRFGGYTIKAACKYKAFSRVYRKDGSQIISQKVDYFFKVAPVPL
jgi:hypothetical protein